MTKPLMVMSLLAALVLDGSPASAQVVRIRHAKGQNKDDIAKTVSASKLVFPSGAMGASGDAMQQVDQVVEQIHKDLGEVGLGIGAMMQHTIYLKDGAAQPIAVIGRFHATARKLAPSLLAKPSVGTIVRVPSFPDPNTLVGLDVVAANPGKGQPDEFTRHKFTAGPQEIVETVTVDNVVFTAGLEAMDFVNRRSPPNDIDVQVDIIVNKIHSALQKSGLTIGNMIAHNLYVTKGTDPIRVINKFHEGARKLAPGLAERPSVGTLAIVDGMAAPSFLLEVDVIAAHPKQPGKPDTYQRFPFVPPMDIVKSVNVDDVVFLAGMEGVDRNGKVSPDVLEQVEVAVKKIDDTLKQSGLTIGDMVKHKLYVKTGADASRVREAFHRAATRLAPALKQNPSAETVIVVEGLAGQSMLFEASVIAARPK